MRRWEILFSNLLTKMRFDGKIDFWQNGLRQAKWDVEKSKSITRKEKMRFAGKIDVW